MLTALAAIILSHASAAPPSDYMGEKLWRSFGKKLALAHSVSFTVRVQIPSMQGQDVTEDTAFARDPKAVGGLLARVKIMQTSDKKESFVGLLDGQHAWTYDASTPTTVARFPAASHVKFLSDFEISFGYWAGSPDRFQVTGGSITSTEWAGTQAYSIQLTDTKNPSRKYELFMDLQNDVPVGVSMKQLLHDGRTMETKFTYSNMVLDPALPANYFVYTVPSGVSVKDYPDNGK